MASHSGPSRWSEVCKTRRAMFVRCFLVLPVASCGFWWLSAFLAFGFLGLSWLHGMPCTACQAQESAVHFCSRRLAAIVSPCSAFCGLGFWSLCFGFAFGWLWTDAGLRVGLVLGWLTFGSRCCWIFMARSCDLGFDKFLCFLCAFGRVLVALCLLFRALLHPPPTPASFFKSTKATKSQLN